MVCEARSSTALQAEAPCAQQQLTHREAVDIGSWSHTGGKALAKNTHSQGPFLTHCTLMRLVKSARCAGWGEESSACRRPRTPAATLSHAWSSAASDTTHATRWPGRSDAKVGAGGRGWPCGAGALRVCGARATRVCECGVWHERGAQLCGPRVDRGRMWGMGVQVGRGAGQAQLRAVRACSTCPLGRNSSSALGGHTPTLWWGAQVQAWALLGRVRPRGVPGRFAAGVEGGMRA